MNGKKTDLFDTPSKPILRASRAGYPRGGTCHRSGDCLRGDARSRNASRASAYLALALIAFALPLAAQSGGNDADSVVRRMEANQVFDTSRFEARLSVTNAFGTTDNDFIVWQRRGGDTMIEITTGPDRGQKVLRQGANIYLFYPDADEVIWLKGSALKNSMMGSDFSYEDLTDDKTILDRFTVSMEGDGNFAGRPCWHLILVAKTRSETYAKQELWVDKELNVTLHGILYSASGKPLRDLVASDIRAVGGKNVAFKTVMKDLLKKNSATEMSLSKAEIDIKIPDTYFNREELAW